MNIIGKKLYNEHREKEDLYDNAMELTKEILPIIQKFNNRKISKEEYIRIQDIYKTINNYKLNIEIDDLRKGVNMLVDYYEKANNQNEKSKNHYLICCKCHKKIKIEVANKTLYEVAKESNWKEIPGHEICHGLFVCPDCAQYS